MRAEPNIWKGMVAGAIAGLAGAWVMTRFQNGWSEMQQKFQNREGQRSSDSDSEDATMKAAEAISHDLLHKDLTKEQKQKFGPVIHYLFGTATGAVYGALAERMPSITRRWGTEYASLVFLTADELAVPALKLSKPATQAPLSSHLYGWASHLVYGASTESARRIARAALGNDSKASSSGSRLSQRRVAQKRAA